MKKHFRQQQIITRRVIKLNCTKATKIAYSTFPKRKKSQCEATSQFCRSIYALLYNGNQDSTSHMANSNTSETYHDTQLDVTKTYTDRPELQQTKENHAHQ
jgi:hypothetical protein